MAEFMVNGAKEPFSIVQMQHGEALFAESDSMMAMQEGIEITGEMRGGFLNSVARAMTSDEGLFQQTIKASREAVIMLSPQLPGDIKVFDVAPGKGIYLNEHAFFCAEASVSLDTRRNQDGGSLFSGEGFFLMHAHGRGKLAINGLGSIEEIEISADSPLIVDTGHLLAWEEGIHFEVKMNGGSSGGFFGRAMNAVTSGEGFVMHLRGNGKIFVASRNVNAYGAFIRSFVPNS